MKSLWLWVHAGLLGCLVLGAAPGCSDEGGKKGPPSYVGEETSALIEADKGGELAVGAVKLKVPADALTADKKLTVKVLDKDTYPDKRKIAIDVYEFGPKGTTFEKEVELEFDLQGVEVGKKRPQVVVLDEDAKAWKVVEGSQVQGNKVHAKTTHFSFYTVLLEEAASGGGGGDGVDELPRCDADFTPCGGDIEGTWRFTSGCAAGVSTGAYIPPPTTGGSVCADTVSSVTLGTSGTASFLDGSYDIDQVLKLDYYYRISLACLQEIARVGGQTITCESIQGVETGGYCVHESSTDDVASQSEGTYTAEGGTVTLESNTGLVVLGLASIDPQVEYCVTGNTLTLRLTDPATPSSVQVYVAERVLQN
jgi:hypothetical protein